MKPSGLNHCTWEFMGSVTLHAGVYGVCYIRDVKLLHQYHILGAVRCYSQQWYDGKPGCWVFLGLICCRIVCNCFDNEFFDNCIDNGCFNQPEK